MLLGKYIKKKLKAEKLKTVFIQHRVNKITLSFHFNSICVECKQQILQLHVAGHYTTSDSLF